MSSASKSHPKKKRRLSRSSGKIIRSDEAVLDWWDVSPPVAPLKVEKVTKHGRLVEYDCMVLKPSLEESRTCVPPAATASEEEWERSGWIVEVGQGRNSALCLPVYSEVVSRQAYDLLSEEEKDRCVFDTEHDGVIYYCPRNHVDKDVDDKEHERFYLANCVRFSKRNESPNCRLHLNWDWKEGEGANRALLVSICKTQSATDWKLDQVHARRQRVSQEDDPRWNALVVSNLREVIVALDEVLKVVTQVRDHLQVSVGDAEVRQRVLPKAPV